MKQQNNNNIKKLIYLIAFAPIMLGCVSQTEYDKLKTEKEKLQNDYDILLEEKRQIEIEKNSKKYFSKEEALSVLKDYYDFYNRDMYFRNAIVRRINNNTFEISLENHPKNASNDVFISTVLTLVINNDGSYKVNL